MCISKLIEKYILKNLINGGSTMVCDFDENVMIKKQQIKKDIKRTAGKCAMILLMLSISTYLIGSIIIHVLKLRSFVSGIDISVGNESEMILGISKDAYNFWVGYFPCILADIIAIFACTIIFKKRVKSYIEIKKEVSPAFITCGAAASIGVGIISSIIFLIYSIIIHSQGLEIPSPDFSIPQNTIYLVLFMAYTCLIAPVFEEIIFRGYILNNLRKYGNLTAIIVSSIFFSMFHFNLVQLVNPILMGIILSFIVIKSESITQAIIVHMFNNIMAMLTTVISSIDSQTIIIAWSNIYYICGILALFYFILRYGREFLNIISEKHNLLQVRKKVLYCFFSKWTVAYVLFYVFVVILTMTAKNIK